MKTTRRFWPLDYDQEVEIYENPSWDLPGLKRYGTSERCTGKIPSPRSSGRPLSRLRHVLPDWRFQTLTRSEVTCMALSSQYSTRPSR